MDFTEVYSDSVGSISLAARSGSLVQVRSLIRSGLSLDVKDNRGWTCLHEAAARGHKGCVREILTAAGRRDRWRRCVQPRFCQSTPGETVATNVAYHHQHGVNEPPSPSCVKHLGVTCVI